MSADFLSEPSSLLTSSTNGPLLGPASSSFSSHLPHQPPPIIPPPPSQVTVTSDSASDSESYLALAKLLSDYLALPTSRPKSRATLCSRTPPYHQLQMRKSSRVSRTPHFLVNQYHLDVPKTC